MLLLVPDVLRHVWDFLPMDDVRLDHVCAAWRRAVHGHRLAFGGGVSLRDAAVRDHIRAHAATAAAISVTLNGRNDAPLDELLSRAAGAVQTLRLAIAGAPASVHRFDVAMERIGRGLQRLVMRGAAGLSAIELRPGPHAAGGRRVSPRPRLPAANDLDAAHVRLLRQSVPWAQLDRFAFDAPRDSMPVHELMITALRCVRCVSLRWPLDPLYWHVPLRYARRRRSFAEAVGDALGQPAPWCCERLCLHVAAAGRPPLARPEAERALGAALRLPQLRHLEARLDGHRVGNADGIVDWSVARGLRTCQLGLRCTGLTTTGFLRWWDALRALPGLVALDLDARDNRGTLRITDGLIAHLLAPPPLDRLRIDLRHNDRSPLTRCDSADFLLLD